MVFVVVVVVVVVVFCCCCCGCCLLILLYLFSESDLWLPYYTSDITIAASGLNIPLLVDQRPLTSGHRIYVFICVLFRGKKIIYLFYVECIHSNMNWFNQSINIYHYSSSMLSFKKPTLLWREFFKIYYYQLFSFKTNHPWISLKPSQKSKWKL